MQQTDPNIQQLYAVLTLHSANTVERILNGRDRIKFVIRGRGSMSWLGIMFQRTRNQELGMHELTMGIVIYIIYFKYYNNRKKN
ncbi:hypothetical protein FRX31_013783 [Thalictrum thalictroides]|uniref:Uncharacterized protein n=1 Tax=Thalictrum thalictroides TaxID=46969 RepID=A0A7J6WH23_THATH|nr:hypothetical protein FRX31_013783 [Thalictrum thalictroides]